jgi:hypothetical protein
MEDYVRVVKLTIVPGKTEDEIHGLAQGTLGKHLALTWSNQAAINCIRHKLTNYEEIYWYIKNRWGGGYAVYAILRRRIDDLVETEYPQFTPAPLAKSA